MHGVLVNRPRPPGRWSLSASGKPIALVYGRVALTPPGQYPVGNPRRLTTPPLHD
jgi:hypothetical protein